MATKDEIKNAILKVAGDPVSGAIKDLCRIYGGSSSRH